MCKVVAGMVKFAEGGLQSTGADVTGLVSRRTFDWHDCDPDSLLARKMVIYQNVLSAALKSVVCRVCDAASSCAVVVLSSRSCGDRAAARA